MTATIPMTGDVAELIGRAAERVENRSLLLDKFVFHKKWPVVEEQTRHGRDFVKWDEASRWSFLRIAEGADQLLNREAQEKRRRADGQNVEPENRERYQAEAQIASSLAKVRWESTELGEIRSKHTKRFVKLFRDAHGDRASVTIGQLEGRLAINLADSLIQNAGICLDRLFGLPCIPGSAIKGVCRHAALDELKAAKGNERTNLLQTFCDVFGTAENDFERGELRGFQDLQTGKGMDRKGAVAFLPAYPVNEAKIVVDLTNVHYPDYYRTGNTRDLSKEKPRPNSFPAVEMGAQFAFCLVLNGMSQDTELLSTAKHWLEVALTERGIGAKTAAGYGWFSLRSDVPVEIEDDTTGKKPVGDDQKPTPDDGPPEDPQSPEEQAAEELLALDNESFAQFAKDIAGKEEHEQRAFISLITGKEKRERWKTWKKKKADLADKIRGIAEKLELPLP